MMHRSFRIAFPVLALALGSCGGPIIRTARQEATEGFSYYLPKQLLKVNVERVRTPDGLTDKLGKATDAARTAKQVADQKAEQIRLLESALTFSTAGSPAHAELSRQLGIFRAENEVLKAQLQKANEGVNNLENHLRALAAAAKDEADAMSSLRRLVLARQELDQLLKAARKAKQELQERHDAADGPGKAELAAQLEVARTEEAILVANRDKAAVAVARDLERVRVLQLAGQLPARTQDKITLTLLPPVADEVQRYTAQLVPNAFRSDDLQLKSGTNGLLNTGDVVSIDQTAQVIVAAIQSIGSIAKVGTISTFSSKSLPSMDLAPLQPAAVACPPEFKLEVIFDPADGYDVGRAEDALQCAGLDFDAPDRPSVPVEYGYPDGILYRRKLPLLFQVKQDGMTIQTVQLEIPNGAPAERLPILGGKLVQTDHDFVLENGMLTEHHWVRPSSALAVVKVPGAIAEAIVAIPAQLIQLRIDQTRSQFTYTDEQLKLLKKVAELEAEIARQQGQQRLQRLTDPEGDD